MSQFCMPHWEELRQAVDAAGLGVFVSATSEEVMTKTRRWQEEGVTIDTFEPLLLANVWATTEAYAWGRAYGCPACMLAPRDLIGQAVEKVMEQWRGLRL